MKIDKKIDWLAIKNEYIGGGISQRKLAAKYGIKTHLLLDKANREKWAMQREKAADKARAKAEQAVAKSKAKNATTAERIREKLLARLEKAIDELPDNIGSEQSRTATVGGGESRKKITTIYRLKDLVAAYQALTDGDLKREKLDLEKQNAEAEDW